MSPPSPSSASSSPLRPHQPPSVAARARQATLLSQLDVMALVIGVVIGAGIFSAPALVAMNVASVEHALIAWGVGGLIAVAGALCYAELATTYPSACGEYHYLRMAFGEKVGFLFAWARLTVIPTGSIALLGYVFGDYATQLYGLGAHSAAVYAALMIVVMTLLNLLGLKSGARTQKALTLIEIAGVLLIIVAGLTLAAPEVAPAAPGATDGTQWGLVLVFVMLAYGGWNEAAYASAEVAGAQRGMPRALFWSLVIVVAVYLLLNIAIFHVLGLAGAGSSTAVAADAMRAVMGERGGQLVSVLIAVSALTSVNATILLGARTTYAFGRDEAMFGFLGHWNERLHAPVRAMLVQSAIALGLVLLGAVTRTGFKTMVEYTAPVFWLFFVLTGLSLFVLRARRPGQPRPFSVPAYPLIPLVFVATSLYLLYSSLVYTGVGALVGIAVLLIGLLLLFFRKRTAAQPV